MIPNRAFRTLVAARSPILIITAVCDAAPGIYLSMRWPFASVTLVTVTLGFVADCDPATSVATAQVLPPMVSARARAPIAVAPVHAPVRAPVATAPAPSPPPPFRPGARFVLPPGHFDVAASVARARVEYATQHRRVVVYVGAEWCGPCVAFHEAVEQHRLDRAFPDLTLLEFDYDLDVDRLRAAGYSGRLLPYFTVPGPDGRATSAHMEGGIMDPEAIDEIVPRLQALLNGR